ncbi:HD domain-containing protein [Flintibacter porci]|uniref:HD domain-containing protein n=1 Tax=Flintibacter porci TaxID=3342383 RepID=UPI003F8A1791
MKIYDRLYGEMKFPPIIQELLNCPGLLRLRDVRMANNQFVAFPSFASASRYEHSLGVCYLATICADSLKLEEKDATELMIACLYHDVGTPPFAHAMEEVLQARFGFDHEQNLKELIMGTNGFFDGSLAQVYQGQRLKLISICQGAKARRLGLDLHRIARIAAGDSDEFLAPLVNSTGIDLDNIDNIFRATSAMGLIHKNYGDLAKSLANSFCISSGKICINAFYNHHVKEWQRIRDLQYSAIFESVDDFAYQTMIKKAISYLLEEDESSTQLNINSWRLTDSEITHNYLLKHRKSREIMQRVLLCRPFSCLGIFYVKGNGVSAFINTHIQEIEEEVREFLMSLIGKTKEEDSDFFYSHPVYANFYPDKRKRSVKNQLCMWNQEEEIREEKSAQGALLGLFTSYGNSYYIEDTTSGKKRRKTMSIRKDDLLSLLKKSVLKNFEISLYGSNENGEPDTDFESSQLGLF